MSYHAFRNFLWLTFSLADSFYFLLILYLPLPYLLSCQMLCLSFPPFILPSYLLLTYLSCQMLSFSFFLSFPSSFIFATHLPSRPFCFFLSFLPFCFWLQNVRPPPSFLSLYLVLSSFCLFAGFLSYFIFSIYPLVFFHIISFRPFFLINFQGWVCFAFFSLQFHRFHCLCKLTPLILQYLSSYSSSLFSHSLSTLLHFFLCFFPIFRSPLHLFFLFPLCLVCNI